MEAFFEKEHILTQMLFQNVSLHALCNKMEEMLGNPVAIGDFFRNKLVWSDGFPQEDLDDQINRYNHMPREIRERSFEQAFRWLQDRQPRILELPYMRTRRLVCGVFYHDSLAALFEAPDLDEHFEKIEWDFFKMCSDILGLALHFSWFPTDKALAQPYPMLWNHFQHYTDHKWNDDWKFCVELSSIRCFQLFWLRLGSKENDFAAAIEQLPTRCWVLPFRDGILILLDSKYPELCKEAAALALQHNVVVGASDVFSSLDTLDAAKKQAECALSVSRRLARGPGLYFYNECRLYDMLCRAGKHLELGAFEDTVLKKIRVYDEEHHTEYEKTLRTYLTHRQNLQEVAGVMFIHKNTVIYRVNKLKELFEIDFNDCRQLAHLYCSFLMSDICAAQRKELDE